MSASTRNETPAIQFTAIHFSNLVFLVRYAHYTVILKTINMGVLSEFLKWFRKSIGFLYLYRILQMNFNIKKSHLTAVLLINQKNLNYNWSFRAELWTSVRSSEALLKDLWV